MSDSKQPGRTIDAKSSIVVGMDERVYEPTKLAALFDELAAQGAADSQILRNIALKATEVHSPKTRISLTDLVTACENAIQLSSDRRLPYRIGASIHISAYGMYGFAILCCPDFRDAMSFAWRYHSLAAPLATIEFKEEKGFASWTIEPTARASIEPRLYRFITEMQIGIHISLMRDIMGAGFVPDHVSLTYPEADDFRLPADLIGCPIRFSYGFNRIVFGSDWLDQAARLGNKTTYPMIVSLCDELLDELKWRVGIAGEIRKLLLRDIANPPTLAAVAKQLDISDRSLRRQLRQQGMSFRGLLDDLRSHIALKFLRTTKLPNEDIALALGFSDAANFRRAFRRWTKKSPNDIRFE